MNFRGFRLHKTILVFLLVLALGLSLQHFYQRTKVLQPLLQELSAIPGIEEVALEPSPFPLPNRTVVVLSLSREVPLALTLGQVQQTLKYVNGAFEIQLKDEANLELWNLYRQIQVAIEEANITGEFVLLEQRVENWANEAGVAWELAVERDEIYLRLSKESKLLQRVIKRGLDDGEITVTVRGGITNG